MRIVRLSLVFGLGLALACGSGDETMDGAGSPAANSAVADTSEATPVGAVRGVVRDARTDRPIVGALVSAGEYGTSTDDAGAYLMSALPPGPAKVRAYRRGFRSESTTAMVEAGTSAVIDLTLAPADPPCCTLAGRWSGRFALDSAGLNSRPRTRSLEGTLVFEAAEARGPEDELVDAASGDTDLDFGSLIGADVPVNVGDIRGLVFHGDSVAITLLPRLGDWALELRGRQSADTVRGNWFQRASCCGAYGRFVLVRNDESDRGGRGLR